MVDFKALVPWRGRSETPTSRNDLFAPLAAFRREVDRVFDSFVEGFGGRDITNGRDWRSPMPAFDITDKELVITAEVPGISEKDVEVTISGDVLAIKAEKKAEHTQPDATSRIGFWYLRWIHDSRS
jgi:HSP20 family protein